MSVNMRKSWNTTAFMTSIEANQQALMKVIAMRAKDIGRAKFQGIAPAHSDPGEYPAEQTGTMKQAFDAEVFKRINWHARFGVFGASAYKKPPNESKSVGEYARELALGDESRNLEPRPWHEIVVEILKREHWDDIVD